MNTLQKIAEAFGEDFTPKVWVVGNNEYYSAVPKSNLKFTSFEIKIFQEKCEALGIRMGVELDTREFAIFS